MPLQYVTLDEPRLTNFGWMPGRLRPTTQWPGPGAGKDRKDVVVALHESAHAVVALHLGFRCFQVKSRPTYSTARELISLGSAEVPTGLPTLTNRDGTRLDEARVAAAVIVSL